MRYRLTFNENVIEIPSKVIYDIINSQSLLCIVFKRQIPIELRKSFIKTVEETLGIKFEVSKDYTTISTNNEKVKCNG